MRTLAILPAVLALLVGSACASITDRTEQEREINRQALTEEAARIAAAPGFVVVRAGQVYEGAETLTDALRTGRAGVHHRFVFRPGEEGDVTYRMSFVPAGTVAGRRFADALGIEVIPGASGALVLEQQGLSVRFARGQPRVLAVDVAPASGGPGRRVQVHFDPAFDGPLVLDSQTAAALHLSGSEIPGEAAVTVALGRPFRGHRARVHVHVPDLAVESVIEVIGVIQRAR
jgi:hypothetical protein